MKTLSAFTLLTLLVAGAAYAHIHLTASTPAEGSVLKAAPATFELKFSGATRLTALTLQKEGAAEQKLAPLPGSVTDTVKVPAPKLIAGKYTLQWRAVGDDGHVMTGKVQFIIDPNSTPTTGKTPQKHPHAH